MPERTKDVFSLIKHLRWKYSKEQNKIADGQLDSILWYSVPLVYPDYYKQSKRYVAEWEKYRKRKARWFGYVKAMQRTFGSLCLVTLTFGDTYESTTSETRAKYAKRWLSDNCKDYIACLDIGKQNGREHYHALTSIDFPVHVIKRGRGTYFEPDEQDKAWQYGFYTIKPIKEDKSSQYKTMSYAFKACVYAFKSSKDDKHITPFHKRGVEHTDMETIQSDDDLPFSY